jgi:hypothetical protein
MLSGPGWVYVLLSSGQKLKLWVPQGAGALFRADVLHAGASYMQFHHRAHWYLVSKVAGNPGIEDGDDWRAGTDKDGRRYVALWDADSFQDWAATHVEDSADVHQFRPGEGGRALGRILYIPTRDGRRQTASGLARRPF